MRIAVISDIHADLRALEGALAAIEAVGADQVWCLGDIVGLGGDAPAGVVDVVRERCALVLAGNHDAWVAGTLSLDMLALPRQRAELVSQRAELTREQLTWLATRPPHARRAGVELWHGSADDPLTGWIASVKQVATHLNRQRTGLGLIGHSHRALAAHSDGSAVDWHSPSPERIELPPGGKWVLNPGAVTAFGRWLELDLGTRVAIWHIASEGP